MLIDGTVAGYPIRIAIECKNEKKIVGVEQIDAFIGKLQYVGLAPQQAIFVSIKGFSRGAIARAKAAGVRTLVLTGLAPHRLEAAVLDAMHAVIYLWPVATEWAVLNDVPGPVEAPEEIGTYLDENGAIIGSVPDLAWRAWIEGETPNTLGRHILNLRLPKGWRNVIAGSVSIPEHISVTVDVYGIVMVARGTASRHALIDAERRVVEKLQLKAKFSADTNARAEIFSSESELTAFVAQQKAVVSVMARVRLPRLQWMGVFWPFSMRVAQELDRVSRDHEAAGRERLTVEDFTAVEQPRLENMWEPLWLSPLLKGILDAQFE